MSLFKHLKVSFFCSLSIDNISISDEHFEHVYEIFLFKLSFSSPIGVEMKKDYFQN